MYTAQAATLRYHSYTPCQGGLLYCHPTQPATLWVQLGTGTSWYTSTGHKGTTLAALCLWCAQHAA